MTELKIERRIEAILFASGEPVALDRIAQVLGVRTYAIEEIIDALKEKYNTPQSGIHLLRLEGRENHLPNQLSGGQQQRVSIGRALMNAPAIVLADEPTGNLDSKNSQEIMALLKESNKKFNQTLIVITHDESIALQADRIIAIEDGQITRDEVIRK